MLLPCIVNFFRFDNSPNSKGRFPIRPLPFRDIGARASVDAQRECEGVEEFVGGVELLYYLFTQKILNYMLSQKSLLFKNI